MAMTHPLNLLMILGSLWLCVVATSLCAYYILPPAAPGLTHVLDAGTGKWRLKAWARALGPLYRIGAGIVHHSPLPYRRITIEETRRVDRALASR
jgi:hypothetical protein